MRWLAAAAELAENRAQRMLVTFAHTTACHLHGEHERGLRGARLLLDDFADQLAPDVAQEVQVIIGYTQPRTARSRRESHP